MQGYTCVSILLARTFIPLPVVRCVCSSCLVAKKRGRPGLYERRFNFLISSEQDAALKALHLRDGISPSEATRRALSEYLIKKGVLRKTKTKS